MLSQVVLLTLPGPWSCVNGNIVHIDHHAPPVDEVSEDRVHHGLESGRRVSEAEEHDRWFVEPFVGDECCFPSILWFNEDLVVPPLDVDTGELCAVS